MFKKLFSFVLLIVCCISSNQLYVNATELSSTKLDKCMEIGEDFLHDYYYTIDMKQKLNLSRYEIDYNVEQYINLKHELMKNRLVRNNVDVVYCDIDVSFYDYKFIDDEIEIVFNVLVSHQYGGCNFLSESMQQVKLGFTSTNNGININNYFEFTEFDKHIGFIQNETNEAYDINNLQYTDDTIKSLIQIYNQENIFYDSIFPVHESDKTSKEKNFNTIIPLSLSNNRNDMVSYALENCSKDSPSSGNPNYAPYYDFSHINYAYDCTNFTSHCLLAGGAVENHNTWYYDSLDSRTPSWSGVNEFFEFITTNNGIGPRANGKTLQYSCPLQYVNWLNGDIIQLQYSNYGQPGFGHSTIVTGSYSYSPYNYVPTITSITLTNHKRR